MWPFKTKKTDEKPNEKKNEPGPRIVIISFAQAGYLSWITPTREIASTIEPMLEKIPNVDTSGGFTLHPVGIVYEKIQKSEKRG